MDWLWLAHDAVARNAGSKTAGCDGIVMADFDRDAEGNLRRLREALQSGKFEACPVRRVYIPKANGKRRPLGIPSIRDRIVQEAVRMTLEPIFEPDFSQQSFGFRPIRCTMDAIRHLMWFTQEHAKYFWAIEGDISAYFDTIHHRKLMKPVGRRVKDAGLLDLIWKFLRAGVMERRLFKGTELGTPQGGIVTPPTMLRMAPSGALLKRAGGHLVYDLHGVCPDLNPPHQRPQNFPPGIPVGRLQPTSHAPREPLQLPDRRRQFGAL
jgi:RNA-directed DNA polymerase